MAHQDFSDKTVAQKLGINPGDEVTILNAPENYLNLIDNIDIFLTHKLQSNTKFIHYFAQTKSDLEKDFPRLKKSLSKNGTLWISNKKGDENFNQNDVQKIGLENGLVDIKIASINDQWSAMKFVFRLRDR